MRSALPIDIAVVALLVIPGFGCYEPSIEGLIDPDADCEFSPGGSTRTVGTLDVGGPEMVARGYEAVLLVEGRVGDAVTSGSVAFSANGERLPNVTVDGDDFVFPSVEGERHTSTTETIDADGVAAVPFPLVTKQEARALQVLAVVDDLDLLIELRVVAGRATMAYPAFVELRVCSRCLVGVGAEVEDGRPVCPDGSAPTPVSPAPCREGQDDVFSTCDAR